MSGPAPTPVRSSGAPDPFALTADPRAYVPRAATEAALRDLEEALAESHAAVVFSGPPGIGKTLVLRLLRDRLGDRMQVVSVPHPNFAPVGLWLWVTSELQIEPGMDPKRTVRRLAARAEAGGSAILLLVDDAHALPAETLSDLLATSAAEPGLRMVLTVADGEHLPVPLADDVPRVRLAAAMTARETREYVAGRLAASAAEPSVRRRFDAATLDTLYSESEGVPIRVHALADRVIRGLSTEPLPEFREPRVPPTLRPAPRAEEPAPAPAPGPLPPAVPVAPRAPWAERIAWGACGVLVGVLAGFWALTRVPPTATVPLPAPVAATPDPLQPPPQLSETPLPPTPMPAVEEGSAPVSDETAVTGALAEAPSPVAAGSLEASTPVAGPGDALQPVVTSPVEEPPPVAAAPVAALPPVGALPVEAPAPVESLPPVAAAPMEALPSVAAGPVGELPPVAAAPVEAPPSVDAAPPALRIEASPRPAPEPAAAEPAPVAEEPPAAPEPPRRIHFPPGVPVGSLHVRAEPWAAIEVDGVPVGETPLAGVRLPYGEHRVVARFPNGTVVQRTVETGEATSIVLP